MVYHIILDIDETLVQCVKETNWNKISKSEQNKYHFFSSEGDVFVFRPHLEEFLERLFNTCVVSLWTWGGDSYAHEVAEIITHGHPERFAHILSSKDVELSMNLHNKPKDLTYIWRILQLPGYTPKTTLLIDNLESNTLHMYNKKNSFHISNFAPFQKEFDSNANTFYMDMSNDTELLYILSLLESGSRSPGNITGGRRRGGILKTRRRHVKRQRI